jgi:hypothetical protein
VLRLVYWSELKNPKQNLCATISQIGVPAPMVAKSTISRPRITVLEINTHGSQSGPEFAASPASGSGLYGSESQANLPAQRKDEWDSADSQAGEEAAVHPSAECANAKRIQAQGWKRDPRRVPSTARKQQDGNGEQPKDLARAQRMFTEYLQHIRKQRHSGGKQNEARDIERICTFAIVRQMQIYQALANRADRQTYQKLPRQ